MGNNSLCYLASLLLGFLRKINTLLIILTYIFLSKMNGFIANSTFAIKAYLKYRALYFLSVILGFSIIIFGVTLRTLERYN